MVTEIKYREIEGDLIKLALAGQFDVIAHGCNCFCTMHAGIAVPMTKAFAVNKYPLEVYSHKGNIDKLGRIDYGSFYTKMGEEHRAYAVDKTNDLWESEGWVKHYAVNAYTQYNYGKNHADGDDKPIDYSALRLCMKKINHVFKGKKVGLPRIGAGLAGGDWNIIQAIIQEELRNCDTTVVRLP